MRVRDICLQTHGLLLFQLGCGDDEVGAGVVIDEEDTGTNGDILYNRDPTSTLTCSA
jgi:hypothetical protein